MNWFFALGTISMSFFAFSGTASAIPIVDTTYFTANGTVAPEDYDAHGFGDVNLLESPRLTWDGIEVDYVSWTHHFTAPLAGITSGLLTLYLKDDRHDPWWLPLEIGSGFAEGGIDFGEVDTNDYSYDLKVSALEDGLFSVTLASLLGDFYIEKSVLTINYGEPVSVPEPGALTLLGIGLVGTALAARRRNRQVK